MRKNQFTVNDFMAQLEQVRRLGPMDRILGCIPGMSEIYKGADIQRQMDQMEVIYNSMTKDERKNTDLLDAQRRRRISRGAGVDLTEVGQFQKQFEITRDAMRAFGRQ